MNRGAQAKPAENPGKADRPGESQAALRAPAAVILNADDWGRDAVTTDRILDCLQAGAVSSASAMVFMEDSARAAQLAHGAEVDTGLHLNFTLAFSAPECPPQLREQQAKLRQFLLGYRLAPLLYHPGLARSFEYVVRAQMEEYERLYGAAPRRIDGHHHMHLAANVMGGKLLPAGAVVRRNFFFRAGEKSFLNRAYRSWRDRQLARRYRIADYFFDLLPLWPERLEAIFALAAHADVEIETHPANDEEYSFLRGREFANYARQAPVSRGYILRGSNRTACHCTGSEGGFKAVRNHGSAV